MQAEVTRLSQAKEKPQPSKINDSRIKQDRDSSSGAVNDSELVKKINDLEHKVSQLKDELAFKEKEKEDLKNLIGSKDKTIEELKRTLSVHVDKQVFKNTTRTESHVF